ncbi:uncharacterized protein NECHADRAFT_82776 [Fusarium vanettenii 77-13-4]|uniref:Uncharacterized protein n=1 Tax=Fusarium vanettenii (strain ATCC MYA-4622 / CBS 123669 / FGSC 9596 / NRRL 45880 / 77-13-4) TaxID=660122 RepID=C7YWT4_FUSV7|nr:uncharacterized protein NECHADRAFT_82776 [Fusarium vanettenii 77-13-4]EEU43715.1 predicted protein [Fusarium vanettenii 77-13-4]
MPMHPWYGETERFPCPHDSDPHSGFAQKSSLPTIHETATQGYPIENMGHIDQFITPCGRLVAQSALLKTPLQSICCDSPPMSEQESSTPSPGMTPHDGKSGPTDLGCAHFHRDTFSVSAPSLSENRPFPSVSAQEESFFGNQPGQADNIFPLGGHFRNPLLSHNPFEPNHDELLISTTIYGTFWLPHHTAGPVHMEPWVSKLGTTEHTSDEFGSGLPSIQFPQTFEGGRGSNLGASEQMDQELIEIRQKLRALEESRAQRRLNR